MLPCGTRDVVNLTELIEILEYDVMSLHHETFNYQKPTEDQINKMQHVRDAAFSFTQILEANVPDGPDKTYLIRKFREVAMWANVAITKQPDGSPRV